jgi:pimeloyl-ACP methyl ester carboxylesterase
LWLTLSEGARIAVEVSAFFWSWSALRALPRGDGHPVLVLPGFTAADFSTLLLRRFLKELGYDVYGWMLGTNTGRAYLKPMLLKRINEIVKRNPAPITLIGHSLGGVFARELAFSFPSHVRQVITLGSPIRIKEGEGTNELVRRLFERFSRQSPTQLVKAGFARHDPRPPRVPSTAIFSRTDGVVSWQSCLELESLTSQSIEVPGSHLGLIANPLALWLVADRLALPYGQWQRFDSSKLGWVAAELTLGVSSPARNGSRCRPFAARANGADNASTVS